MFKNRILKISLPPMSTAFRKNWQVVWKLLHGTQKRKERQR